MERTIRERSAAAELRGTLLEIEMCGKKVRSFRRNRVRLEQVWRLGKVEQESTFG